MIGISWWLWSKTHVQLYRSSITMQHSLVYRNLRMWWRLKIFYCLNFPISLPSAFILDIHPMNTIHISHWDTRLNIRNRSPITDTDIQIWACRYQVFILTCPANLPFSVATHPWFVCVADGDISRYEVLYRANDDGIHVHKDLFPAFDGISMLPYRDLPRWKPTLRMYLSSDDPDSEVARLIRLIRESTTEYMYSRIYHLYPGPNSNTYIATLCKQAWVNYHPSIRAIWHHFR